MGAGTVQAQHSRAAIVCQVFRVKCKHSMRLQGSAHSGRQWSGPTTTDLKATITHLTATSSKRSDKAHSVHYLETSTEHARVLPDVGHTHVS